MRLMEGDTVSLTEKELEDLKEVFTEKWPDAARYLRTTTPGTNMHNLGAVLWLGFKEGYKYGRLQ